MLDSTNGGLDIVQLSGTYIFNGHVVNTELTTFEEFYNLYFMETLIEDEGGSSKFTQHIYNATHCIVVRYILIQCSTSLAIRKLIRASVHVAVDGLSRCGIFMVL